MQESILGLTHLEVEKRREMGEGGNIPDSITKTKAQILKENIFTLFNLLNFLYSFLYKEQHKNMKSNINNISNMGLNG